MTILLALIILGAAAALLHPQSSKARETDRRELVPVRVRVQPAPVVRRRVR